MGELIERTGTVTGFDEAAGLGTVADAEGSELPFQCVEIADGTRTIAVGAAVRYTVSPKLGRYEAATIRRLDA